MQRTLLWVGCLLLLLAPLSADASRGITVKLKANERAGAADAGSVKLYSNSYALVVGIDNYHAGWPRLGKAVADARAIAHVLRAKGFEVTLKTDLDSIALMQEFKKFFAIKGADPNARLLLWYAGHGHTINGEGYLVPADAPPAVSPAFKVSAIPMRDFGSLVRMANAKHVLSIFDSCFSGTVFQARAGAAPVAITKKTIKPVREFLTSGDAGQQVRDDGSFREYFIRALNGDERADVNDDGYVTGEELGLFMTQSMSALTNAAQTPKFGKLQDVHFNQGDYVFQLPSGARRSVTSTTMPSSESNQDSLFWSSIKDSHDSAVFKAYLNQFPNGTFAGLARLKVGKQVAMAGRRQNPSNGPKYALTIHAVPVDARIRILNIGPKYRPGMQLAPGKYHISMSRSGYAGKDEWIQLGERDLTHPVSLERVVVKAQAAAKQPSVTRTVPFEMVSIPGRSFRMGKYEVTQSQWKLVMGRNPSEFKGANRPVESISWDDIQLYIRKLNSLTGKRYRLPTENEWKYACDGGHSSNEYCGGDDMDSAGWYHFHGNSGNKTRPVGYNRSNAYGLYDMSGNVWEWTKSCWEGDCGKRVLRGGSCFNDLFTLRSANRDRASTSTRFSDYGFRLVQD